MPSVPVNVTPYPKGGWRSDAIGGNWTHCDVWGTTLGIGKRTGKIGVLFSDGAVLHVLQESGVWCKQTAY